MTHIRRRALILLVLSVPPGVLGGYLGSRLILWPIAPHVGDGQFRDTSWQYPWGTIGIPITGYSITFERFDLAQGYNKSYTLERLPDIEKDLGVFLCIADPRHALRGDSTRERLKAEFQFDILDEHGKLICRHENKPIAKMHWADPQGGANCYGLYSLGASEFTSRKEGKYTLHIRYSPDPQLSGFHGFIYIRCGGYA